MRSAVLKSFVAALWLLVAPALSGANTVRVSPVEGDAGASVEVKVELDNSVEVYALQMLIDLPEEGACTVRDAVAAGRAAGFSASAGIRAGQLSVMLYSLQGQSIVPGSGEVARFTVEMGDKPLTATLGAEAKIADASGAAIACTAGAVSFKCLRPRLEITDTSIDFGRVALTDKAVRTIRYRNTGTAPLKVSDVIFGRDEFAVTAGLPATLAPGASATISVEFTPDERGAFSSTARLVSDSGDSYSVVDIAAVPYAVNKLTIGSASGVSDSEVEVAFSLENMDAVNGLTLEMRLPKGLEYVDGSFEPDAVRAAGFASSATCKDGVLKIMMYSLSNAAFAGVDGPIGSMRLKLSGKGSYTLVASKAVLPAFYRGEIMDVLSDCISGRVTVLYPSISVNGSLSLGRTAIPETASAELLVRNYGNAPLTLSRVELNNELLQVETPMPLTIAAGGRANITVCCPGESTGRMEGVMSIYSNDPDQRLKTVNVTAERYAENRLVFKGIETVIADGAGSVAVSLANYTALKGLQFDIVYPADRMRPRPDAQGLDRAEEFQVMVREPEPGVARYFVYSLGGKEIEPGYGAVLALPFELIDGAEAGRMNLRATNFVLSSATLENMNSELSAIPFGVDLRETPRLKGDVNEDGKLTVFDLTSAISIHLNDNAREEYHPEADMNDDGEVTVPDISSIISLIINTK